MKKTFIFILFFTVVLLLFSACGIPQNKKPEQTNTTASITQNVIQPTKTEPPEVILSTTDMAPQETFTNNVSVTENLTPPAEKPSAQIPNDLQSTTSASTKVYEKTGEMAFSDSAKNKYNKAIIDKYGVNPENIVAIYTVPDNDGNLVLEFDGSVDANGKKIRTKDTLTAIYSIDKNLVSKCASENSSKNEYSYGEMKVIYFSTATYIMPEFADKL